MFIPCSRAILLAFAAPLMLHVANPLVSLLLVPCWTDRLALANLAVATAGPAQALPR